MPGLDVIQDYLPLGLGNSDLILGIQWQAKLGAMSAKGKAQVLKFNVGSESVTLKGDPSLGMSLLSLKAMM